MILNAMGTSSGKHFGQKHFGQKHFGLDVRPSGVALPEDRVKNRPNAQLVKNKKPGGKPESAESAESEQKENQILRPENSLKSEKIAKSKKLPRPPGKKKDKKYYYDYRNYSSDINTTNAFQNFFLNNAVPNLYVRRPDFSLLERPGSIDYRFEEFSQMSARQPVIPPFIPEIGGRPPIMPPFIGVPNKEPTQVSTNVPAPMPEIPKSSPKDCNQTPIVFVPAEKEITTPGLEKKSMESSLQDNNTNDKINWKYYIFIPAAVAFLLFLILFVWK